MNRFKGKTVLVTGGNSGIGLATAIAYAREGARLVITGRDQTTLNQAAAQIGDNPIVVRNDAGSVADGNVLAAQLQQQGVMLDAVFINAGIAKFAPLEGTDEDLWDQTFNTNVKGPYFLIKALLPLLNPGAAIVLNASINAHIGMANSSVYSASKAAILSFSKTMSAELVSKGVRVNVVSPGPITTPIFGRMGLPEEQMSGLAEQIRSQIPLGRFGTPDEIAGAVLYLSSAEAAFIVGTELIVDGGMSQL